jgi:Tetracyclin repressor-like, C-terminal domain
LLIAIREQAVMRLSDFLAEAESSTTFFSKYIDFGENNPKHYELLFGSGWKDRRNPESMPPVVSRLQTILAKESGLKLESLKGRAFAIWSLLHGTVMLRIVVKKPGRNWALVKKVCLKSCEILKVSDFEGNGSRPAIS